MILFINAVLMATVSKIVKLLYNLYKNRYEKRSVSYAPFSVHISDSLYYFLRMVYKRVPFSSVVTSSNAGSIAFTKASNHVW